MTMIKMPLACLAMILYAYYFYRKKKWLRTMSSYYFNIFILFVGIHLVADAVTEYTVNYRDRVPELFNYIWHIIFLLSILCVCMLLYFYLLSYVERGIGTRKTVERRVTKAVWGLDMAAILLLPIEYIDTPYGSYSLGGKAYALYVGVIYTLIIVLYNVFRYWKHIDRQKLTVMLISVCVFVVVSIVQIAFPQVLLTSAAVSFIAIGVMTSMEESNQFLDYESGLYNTLGCHAVLEELKCLGEPFPLLAYAIIGPAPQITPAILQVVNRMKKQYPVVCALTADNLLVILPSPISHGRRSPFPAAVPESVPKDSLAKEYFKQFKVSAGQSIDDIMAELTQFKEQCEASEMYHDELTGLLRRKAFIQRVTEALEGEKPFSLLMVDVDNFKAANDTYGHSFGDEVLKGVSQAFRDTLRDRDAICRFGGDEFALMLADVSTERILAEVIGRLNQAVSVIPAAREKGYPVRLSIGVCVREAGQQRGFDDLYRAADSAMYEAKGRGKGQYVIR